MIVNIALIIIVALALFPVGRALLRIVFNLATGALDAYEPDNNNGPGNHHDNFSGEVHPYKEIGGMYHDD